MKKLEELVNKQTLRKLANEGITCWEGLFNIHRKRKDEFWKEFSKKITNSNRKKLEKVLYRECIWDNDKYYYHHNDNLLNDKTYTPRDVKNDDRGVELVKIDAKAFPGSMQFVDEKDTFIEEELIVDRIERTCYRKIKYKKRGLLEIKIDIDYYDLNKIFAILKRDVNQQNFANGYVDGLRYYTYQLTYGDGTKTTYEIWEKSNQNIIYDILCDIFDKKELINSYIFDALEDQEMIEDVVEIKWKKK